MSKVAFVLSAALAASVLSAAEAVNLAEDRDGGFEHGRRHWAYESSSGEFVTFPKGRGIDGSAAMCVKSKNGPITGAAGAYTCFVPVEGGQKYRISVKYQIVEMKSGMLRLNGRTWAKLENRLFVKDKTFSVTKFSAQPVTEGEAGKWQEMSTEFEAPEAANGISYDVCVDGGFEGEVLFDDVRIVKL